MAAYFYRHNNKTCMWQCAIAFLSCLMWIGLDAICEGACGYILKGGLFWIVVLAASSLATFLFTYETEKRMPPEKETPEGSEEPGGGIYKIWILSYFVLFIFSVSFISVCGVNAGEADQEIRISMIPLSSTLLFILAFASLPRLSDSFILLGATVISLPIAWYAGGAQPYPVAQETVLRLMMIAAYITIRQKTTENYKQALLAKEAREKLLTAKEKTIDLIAGIIEERDESSGWHAENVKKYTKIIAETALRHCPECGLTKKDISDTIKASVLHDIGKVRIPDSILQKESSLTDEEMEIIREHAAGGYDILQQIPRDIIDAGCLMRACEITMYHHERADGGGYPFGLTEKDIPLSAQIVALADCYEALTHKRPYKEPYDQETAIRMITEGECGRFSDRMIACLKECSDSLKNIGI